MSVWVYGVLPPYTLLQSKALEIMFGIKQLRLPFRTEIHNFVLLLFISQSSGVVRSSTLYSSCFQVKRVPRNNSPGVNNYIYHWKLKY